MLDKDQAYISAVVVSDENKNRGNIPPRGTPVALFNYCILERGYEKGSFC